MGASASAVCAPGAPQAELVQVWDPSFVFLSFVISTVGAFTSLTTVVYAFSVLRQPSLRGWFHAYMVAAGAAIGGVAVWAMHFVGMQALSLRTCDGRPVAMSYNVVLTITSLVAAIAIGTLVFYLVVPSHSVGAGAGAGPGGGGGGAGARAASAHLPDSSYWILHDVELCGVKPRVGKFAIGRFVLASVLLATGACVMHYMGMAAMYGAYTIRFDGALVGVSVLIAVVAASAGLFIVVQIAYAGLTWFSIALRVVAALVIALAVNCMHYVGMLSASYVPTRELGDNINHHLGPNLSMHALVVVAIAVSYCFAQLLAVYSHLTSLLLPDDAHATAVVGAGEEGEGGLGGSAAQPPPGEKRGAPADSPPAAAGGRGAGR